MFVVGQRRDLKFGTQVGRIASPSIWTKNSLKGVWLRHVTHYKFWGPIHSSGTAEARAVKFCTQVDYRLNKTMKNHPQKGAWL